MIKKVERKFYDTPRFPDYPYNEWETRVARARELMAENGVECLVLWSRENNRYFFGFQTIHWFVKSIQPAVGILPLMGEPVLIVPDFFQGDVEGLCWVNDIRINLEPHQPKSQRELPADVAGVIKELGYGNKRIGLETGPLGCMWIPRPLTDIDAFKGALPGAKFVDGDRVIWGCRMIKSSLEIDRMRKAIAGVTAVELAIVTGYRPGMMEVDLMKVINRARAEQDGMGWGDDAVGLQDFTCSSDKGAFADVMAVEGAPITEAHGIRFDGVCPYKGYVPDNARVYQVGPITPEKRRAYDTLFAAQDAAEAMLKPGVKAKDVYAAMYKLGEEAGYGNLGMGGHGTGLDTHEPPSIDEWCEQIIEEGMVLSIEPWFWIGTGWFGIQDQYVVTNKGCYKILGLDRNIIQVYRPIC